MILLKMAQNIREILKNILKIKSEGWAFSHPQI
jgi:hypothetical protein